MDHNKYMNIHLNQIQTSTKTVFYDVWFFLAQKYNKSKKKYILPSACILELKNFNIHNYHIGAVYL
jgi:hypothetical protein